MLRDGCGYLHFHVAGAGDAGTSCAAAGWEREHLSRERVRDGWMEHYNLYRAAL